MSHPHRPRRPRLSLAAMPALVALLLVGCVSPAPTPEPPPSTSPTPADTLDDLRARTRLQMLLPEEVPGTWTADSRLPDDDAFREVLCGVDVEPVKPAMSSWSRWTRSDEVELMQTARPIGQAEAESIVDALRVALPDCGTDERVVAGQTIAVDITPLELQHADAVAFRQVPQTGLPIPSARVYFARGGCLVAFNLLGEQPGQEAAVLDELVQAVLDKA